MKKYKLNLILLILTIISTIIAGAMLSGESEINLSMLYTGIFFSVSLMGILGIHELGHYIASARHNIPASLPYFIPAPTIIGTFGAFIKVKQRVNSRKAMFDIGVTGPLAGFVVALPVFILGLHLSQVVPSADTATFKLGDSILVYALTRLLAPESYITGQDLLLHPVAFAGWIGFWVTSLNLLPISQLDGGHILYSLFPKYHKYISIAFFVLLIPLGIFWIGWFVWALLIFFFLKLKHPPIVDESQPLDMRRKIIGFIAFVIFVILFIPIPFSF